MGPDTAHRRCVHRNTELPLQALVLIIGVLIWVFNLFNTPPLLVNPAAERQVQAARPAEYQALQQRYVAAANTRRADANGAIAGDLF